MTLAFYSITNLRPIHPLAIASSGSTASLLPTGEFLQPIEDRPLATVAAQAFAEANRSLWDTPEEDAAWADW